MGKINKKNNSLSEAQAEFGSLELTESHLLENKNDIELKLQQSKKDYNEILNVSYLFYSLS